MVLSPNAPNRRSFSCDNLIRSGIHAAISVFLLSSQQCVAAEQSVQPNVVVFLVDDLGYGDLGCYGSRINRTPHIDRLAEGGLRCRDFHSNGPMCSPTRAALLTGCYQQRFGRKFDTALGPGEDRSDGLPLEAVTLAEVLRQAGYSTGMFGKWHLGYKSPLLPTFQGFSEFRGLVSGDGDHHTHIDRSGQQDWWLNDQIKLDEGYTAELLTDYSVEFIERNRQRPFFLYVSHLAIHFPWQGPEDPPQRVEGINYANDKWGIIPDRSNVAPHVTSMITSVDNSLGRIVQALERWQLDRKTLIVFASDNGGYLDYKSGGFSNISSNGPLRGQKTEVEEGGHRVPGIFHWPGRIEAGRVSDEVIMTMDLLPTCARLAHAELPATQIIDGTDLGAFLFDRESLPARTLFWRIDEDCAVRRGFWKLNLSDRRIPELYHLGEDLGETTNRAPDHPDIVADLSAAYDAWERDVQIGFMRR